MSYVSLLDPQTQGHLHEGLAKHGYSTQLEGLLEEALAALTILGRHPERLRSATLAIMPVTARWALDAYGLVEFHDADKVDWTLTKKGEEVAAVLVAAAPEPSEAELAQADEDFAAMLAEANRELGLED